MASCEHQMWKLIQLDASASSPLNSCGVVSQPIWVIQRNANKICIKKLNELFVEELNLAASIPSVLLENGRQVPPLQLSQTPYHNACALVTKVAHYMKRIILRRQNHLQGRQNFRLRH